jgi:hypothetical protein
MLDWSSGIMDMAKLAKAQRAREMARWFRERLRDGVSGEARELMALAALTLESEAFGLEREGGARRRSRKPRLVVADAA